MEKTVPVKRSWFARSMDKFMLVILGHLFGVVVALSLGLKRMRMSHNNGIAARGKFTAEPDPDVPHNAFFAPGNEYPCRIRHGMATFYDDAMPTIRSCSLKLSDNNFESPFDLQCNTGSLSLFWNAASFMKLASMRRQKYGIEYEDYYARYPNGREAAIDNIRDVPRTFAHLTYQNQTPMFFISDGGERYYIKYRICPFDELTEEQRKDRGVVMGSGSARENEPQNQRIAVGETRTRNYLKEEYEHRVRHHGPVRYRLQGQIRRHHDALDKEVFNPTRTWDEHEFPWKNIGHFTITEALNWNESNLTSFSVTHAPKSLAAIPAKSIYDYNSIAYFRAKAGVAYKMRLFMYWLLGMPKDIPDDDHRNLDKRD